MKKSIVPAIIFRDLPLLILMGALLISGCAPVVIQQDTPEPDLPEGAKRVSFALLEDYEKGDDLSDIALDFALLNELEIDTMRTSFGWDNFEPVRGQYDFAWLKDFVSLADQYGIKLRPYIGYTPEWAGAPDSDGIVWNNPPGDYQDWYNFVYQLASALKDHPNVLSYEIYNDLNPGVEAIGDDKNYYLGLTYKDRTKKLAFHTVDLLTDLLDTGTLTIADSEVQVIADEDSAKYLYYHLFKRPDGAQILFVWDRVNSSTVTITLKTPGSSAEHFSLKGEVTTYAQFDGTTLEDIRLTAGNVEIFRINP